MSEAVDMGFDDVLAGNVYKAPEEATTAPAAHPAVEETIVTAPVTPPPSPPPPGLTDAGKQAAIALIALPPLTPPELAVLAREIAMNIREHHDIFKQFKITQVQYDFLAENNAFYKHALETASIEWNSPLSTAERVKLQSTAILEESLPYIGARLQNKAEGLPGVVEAAKLFAKMAGVGERDVGTAGAGERFTINIDLGGDQKITVSTAPPSEADIGLPQSSPLSINTEEGIGAKAVRLIAEGEAEPTALPPFPKGP